jgi:hypothetical protein
MHPRVACSAGAFALVLLLGACGASKPAATASETPTSAAAADSTTSAYRDCLSQHGVTLPNFRQDGQGGNDSPPAESTPPDSTPPDSTRRGQFPGGPNGSADPATQAALEACASLRPQGGNGFGDRPANSQAFQAYYSCLKDNGVDVPDTTATSGPPPSFDRSSPAFAAANAKCQVLLPQRGGGATTTTTQG